MNNEYDSEGYKNFRGKIIGLKFEDIMSGTGADSLILSLNEILDSLNEFNDCLDSFKQAMNKLNEYRENKGTIASLEVSISSLESTKITGITSAITRYSSEITRLKERNNTLKKEIKEIINAINGTEYVSSLNTVFSADVIGSPNLQPKNNSLIAHRGIRKGGVTDNSIEAFEEAGKEGFWGCETDVRFNANGELVCSHNAVKNGENPPTFREYLQICKKYGMTAVVDLKYAKGSGGGADPELSSSIIKEIQEMGMMDSCVLQTNNRNDVSYIRGNSEDVRIWYLASSESVTGNIEMFRENGVECVNMPQTREGRDFIVKKLNENNINVCVWNVQDENKKNILLNNGATYVMTDNNLGTTPYQYGEEDFNNIY